MSDRSFARESEPVRPVSKPTDKSELDADRAADEVVRGRSISPGLLRGSSAAGSDAVHRQETGDDPKKGDAESSNEKEYKEAAKTTVKALSKTKAAQAVVDRILDDPGVRTVKDAVTSTPGKIVGGVAIGGAVTGLALAGKELPFQPPAVPLDFITPGLSGQVNVTGPLNAPTFVGLTITFKPKQQKRPTRERRPPEPDPFTKARNKAEQERLSQEAIDYVVSQQRLLPTIPGIDPGTSGLVLPLLPSRTAGDPKEAAKNDDEPVKRAPASSTEPVTEGSGRGAANVAAVDQAIAGTGRPLDDGIRHRMESRFGHDFSSVRIHDDATAAAASSAIDAAAFTVGDDIAFGTGRFSVSSAEGVHLLAHELAHVVQHDNDSAANRVPNGGSGPLVHQAAIHRRGVFESLGILLGLTEGNWTDDELNDYLTQVTRADAIDGSYDADNKARAIVAKWKAADPDWNLEPEQKALLILEMLDGPTLGEDENAIVDLLEFSDAYDLRVIFRRVPYANIEPDIDGDNLSRLRTFVANRFDGGRAALMQRRVEVLGDRVPANAPNFGFSESALETLMTSFRSADDVIAIVDRYEAGDHEAAIEFLRDDLYPRQLAHLDQFRAQQQQRADQIIQAQPSLAAQVRARIEGIVQSERNRTAGKTEQILHHYLSRRDPRTEAELTSGTTASTQAQTDEINRILSPPVNRNAVGVQLNFVSTLQGETDSYADKMEQGLRDSVDDYYDSLVVGRGPAEHANSAMVRPLAFFEQLGNAARDETLGVFGSFLTNPAPPFVADTQHHRGNLHDQFADIETAFNAMTPDERKAHAKGHVHYLLRVEDWARAINRAHNAAPEFDQSRVPQNNEAQELDQVADRFVATTANVQRVNEIYRNWPGRHRRGDVFVQIFRDPDPDTDRYRLWAMLKTLVHEYLHALAADPYRNHADSFGRGAEYNTLIEGVDSLLTEIVWSRIERKVSDQALRQVVEPDYLSDPPISENFKSTLRMAGRYPSHAQAVDLLRVVGIDGLYAAYFLGLVDRIGGPPPVSGR